MTKHNWPTREQWAENRRALYEGPGSDWRLSQHASEVEIAAAIAACENLWRDLGRQMKTASKEPRSKFKFDTEYDELRSRRKIINIALKKMRDDTLPYDVDEALTEMFAPFYERQHRKREADTEAARREKEATPIDDAAWERELQQRKKSEDDAAHPERFIHRV